MSLLPSTRCLNLLKKCKSLSQLKQAHGQAIACGLGHNSFALSRILALCAEVRLQTGTTTADHAWKLFQGIQRPTNCICNTMIKCLLQNDDLAKVFQVYSTIWRNGMYPDDYTLPYVLKACSKLESRFNGEAVHGSCLKLGLEFITVVGNSFILLYSGFGNMGAAGQVFDEMPSPCVVSWTLMVSGYAKAGKVDTARLFFDQSPSKDRGLWGAMIFGYVQNSCFKECLYLFRQMQFAQVQADEGIFSSILTASAQLGALDTGMWIHRRLTRTGFQLSTRLSTALLDMYLKCGNLVLARNLFDEIPERDVVCWNVMISGVVIHGDGENALKLFSEMEAAGLKPDDITFLTILAACSHSNMASEGLMILDKMCNVYKLEPKSEHFGCIVDLLSREGLLQEAERIIQQMPSSSSSSEEAIAWRALLNACCNQGDTELAEVAAERLFKLESHSGAYTLLANLYAAAGKHDEAKRVRKMMRDRGVEKAPGGSSVEIGGLVREFVAGEKTHLEMEEYMMEKMHTQP